MPIRPHGKGFEVRVQHGGRRFSRTVANRRDARLLEAKLQQQVDDQRAGRAVAHSLEDALHRWLTAEAKVLRSYPSLLQKTALIYPHVRGRALSELPDVAQAVRAAGIRDGLKPATINRRLAILRRVGKLAFREWGWTDQDLGAKVKLLPGETERKVQATPEQVEKLLAAARGRTRKAIIWGALTGMRKGELLGVERSSFVNGSIRLTETKTNRPRLVPLAAGLDPKDFPYGITVDELDKGFRRARSKARLYWLQFRDLRRSCGSWIVQRTRSLKAAQDLLGHSTIAVTAKHYAHLLDEHVREAVKSLPRLGAGLARGKKKAA